MASPGDASLGVEILEVADKEHAEVDARRDRIPAHAVGVIGLAEAFDMAVEATLSQQGVEFIVEDMAGGLGQVGGSDPEVPLPVLGPTTHAHGASLSWGGRDGLRIPQLSSGFSTGC